MRRIVALAVVSLFGACSGGSPTTPAATPIPTPTPPAPAPVYTLSGTITATNGAQPLAGITATINGTSAVTDAAGHFVDTLPFGGSFALAMTGSTIVPRQLTVAVFGPKTVTADAIVLGGGFDLTFYRAFVRNAYNVPTGLEPLRRWTRTPSIYLKTVDEAGEAIHGPTLDLIEAIVKDAVPRWTSGALGVPIVERGTETRVGQTGWITIRFPSTDTAKDSGICGQAQIAVDGGWVELAYHVPAGCRAPGYVIAPRTVRHELGHALGFFHTGIEADVMSGLQWRTEMADEQPTPHELYHAAIAYRRIVGNQDPDQDPASAVNLAPMTVR